jgi:hypothetical protein
LLGDSHAASIKVGVERALQGRMVLAWVGVTGNTCGYIYSATSGFCLEVFNLMRTQLQAHLRSGDMVIVSHAGYKFYHASQQQAQIALLRDLYTTILQPRGCNLVIMGDPPTLPMYAIRCLYLPSNCYASTTNTDQNALLAPLAQESTGIAYIEIHSLFCDSSRCMGQVPGTSTWAYFDDSHLTVSGGLYLWPYLCDAFEAAGFM